MFKEINKVFDFIYQQHVEKASLEVLKTVLAKHADFHQDLVCIHVTGTNGKGSTSKLINDILINSNYQVGLFTSPHMVIANDRIRINNNYISDEDLIYYTNYFYNDIVEYKLNFFQIYVLIALKYFYDKKCDICVIEVGIGGLLDSTNVINGIISIITNINYDHRNTLGDTIVDIAIQKSGIIKENSVTITRVDNPEALAIIEDKVNLAFGSLYKLANVDSQFVGSGQVFTFDNNEYFLNSLAKYQVNNAVIAIKASEVLKKQYAYNITDESIKKALANFEWLGRYEIISEKPRVIVDGAHNIAGIKALINNNSHDMVVIFSALVDKDYSEMLTLLIDNYIEVVFCEFNFNRALKSADLDAFDIEKFSEFDKALGYLTAKHLDKEVLICGSLYFISEIRKYFG